MRSIKIKLFVQFLLYLISFISIFILLNSIFIKKYFIYQEEKKIRTFFNEFNATYAGVESIDRNSIQKIKLQTGRNILILSDNFEHIFDTNFFMAKKDVLKKSQDILINKNIPHPPRRFGKADPVTQEIIDNLDLVKQKGFRSLRDANHGVKLITWTFQLTTGEYIIISISETIINNATLVINNFLIMITTIMGLISGFFLYNFSGKLTDPIITLKNIAIKISELDFSETFANNREDELGVLGNNINHMSRELELALSKLRGELERKEEIDQIRKNFISSVSHELKTPIGLIKGCTEILMYDILKDPDKKKEYFANIVQETDRMDLLVKDMLHISYMESGSFLINKSEFYLDELIEEIYSKYKNKFSSKDAKVEKVIIEKSKVEGDQVRIFQVIVNYLENALRHLDAAKQIQIKMEKLNEKIKVSIFNSGMNIPESELENIWLSFYKTDKAHSRKAGNSGLGLAIVKSIIESHDGEYGVENESQGVRFYFMI